MGLIGFGVLAWLISPRSGGAAGIVVGELGISAAFVVLSCVLAIRTTRDYGTAPDWLIFAGGVGAACGLIAWQFSTGVIGHWMRRADAVHADFIQSTTAFRAVIFSASGAASTIVSLLYNSLRDAEEKLSRAQDSATLHRDAELFKLRQQFGPHFLYNSLNSVSALVSIAPDKAQEMVGRLAHFMRASVRRETAERVPLADELGYLQEYLAIEAVRFGDRLAVRLENGGGCDDCDIPPFLLQPLLENAIKYGVYGTTGQVEISVDISRQPGALRIVITNPFDPLTAPPSGTGFGLEGVGRRLTLLYGRTDLLTTSRADHRFTTILIIPQSHG